MTRHFTLSTFLAASFSALALVTAPAVAQENMAPADQQVLRLVTANMPRSLDPINIDAQRLIDNGFAEPLVHQSLDGASLIPALAASWEMVEPTLWRVELQPNAIFWSGAPVDAAAVAASLKRHQEKNTRAASLLKDVQFIAAGPTTLEIRTPTEDPAFLFKVTTLPIHNAAKADELGDAYATEADLSGYFRTTEFVPGELVVGVPFEGYYGEKPHLQRIEARFVVDPQTRYLAMQSGEADMDANVQFEQLRLYLRQDGYSFPKVANSTWNVWLNYDNELLKDKQLRETLSLGVDRNEIVKNIMTPFATPATGHFPAELPYAISTAQESNPEKAKQLLDQLGWMPGADGIREKDGKRLEFTVLTYGWWQTIAVALESQWRAIGVATTLNVVEPAASNQPMLDGDFDIATYCSCPTATGDLAGNLSQFYRSDSVQNWSDYSNPEVDALIDQLRTEDDPNQRFALAKQIQEIASADTALLWVSNAPVLSVAYASKVKGVDVERPRHITPGMYIATE